MPKKKVKKIKKKLKSEKVEVRKSKKKKVVKKKVVKTTSPKGAKTKKRITVSKIKKLLDFEHIEELFYLLNILNDKQIDDFIKQYKSSSKSKSKDARMDKLVRSSHESYGLLDSIKKELVIRLKDEHKNLRDEISTLRKSGEDVYMEDIRAMSIPLKIRMFDSTSEKEDYYKVKKLFSTVEKSLSPKRKILEKENKKNLKKK